MANLTDLSLSKLPKPDKGQKLYADGLIPGLYLRVSQGGTRSFVLVQGRSRRFHTIGRYPVIKLAEARTAARHILAEKTLGRIISPSVSFAHARDQYLQQKNVRKNTRIYYERNLSRLEANKLSEITPRDINRILDNLSPASRSQAAASYRAFFKWCIQRHYLDRSPCERMAISPSAPRAHVLTDEELRSIWRIGHNQTSTFNTIVVLLLLTGQRRGEIAALQSSWIRDDTITIPASVAKNGREHTFPIGPLASSLLSSQLATATTRLVFPARGSSTTSVKPFNGWSKSKATLDKLSGVIGWTLHDLRRTYATIHARIGTPPHIIERLLNHQSGTISGVAAIYNRHHFLPEMRDAVLGYEHELQRIMAL